MNKKTCRHEILAASASSKVLICRACGVVQLQIQNLSLRYDVEDFLELADMQSQASRKIRALAKIKPARAQLTLVN